MNINELITRLKQAKRANVLATSVGVIANKSNFAQIIEGVRSLLQVDKFDIHILEKPADKEIIRVEDARKWANSLYKSSRTSGRLGIVWQANLLMHSSANALLKIIEEPPRNTTLLLLSENDNFLPTIRSRLQVFSVKENEVEINPLAIPKDSSGIIKLSQEISSSKDINSSLLQLLVQERQLIKKGEGSLERAKLIQHSLAKGLKGRNIKLLVDSIIFKS